MNTSGTSTASISNSIERKISIEEKRSVSSSNKGNSLNTSQQLNDSGKSTSSAELQNHSIGKLREEDESLELEGDDASRCRLM